MNLKCSNILIIEFISDFCEIFKYKIVQLQKCNIAKY